jgi:hypothetical protein
LRTTLCNESRNNRAPRPLLFIRSEEVVVELIPGLAVAAPVLQRLSPTRKVQRLYGVVWEGARRSYGVVLVWGTETFHWVAWGRYYIGFLWRVEGGGRRRAFRKSNCVFTWGARHGARSHCRFLPPLIHFIPDSL